MSATAVPVIDIGAARDQDVVATEIDAACRAVGFFQVVNHGVPDDVISALRTATDAFFAQPLDQKLECRPPSRDINRGYTARGTEALSYSVGVASKPDLFEAFNIGPEEVDLNNSSIAAERHRHFAPNIWPWHVPEMRPALTAYMTHARAVADTLTRLFARALGLGPEGLSAFMSHSMETMRVNHYTRGAGEDDEGSLGMGAHTDYGVVTVLYADDTPGLQILADGTWHDVQPHPGALLVNLGDLTARWTNDRWLSTIHRVQPPPPHRTRRSVAFFLDGNHDAVITCLPTCCSVDNPPRYPPCTAGEHLMEKLMGPRNLAPSAATQTTAGRI